MRLSSDCYISNGWNKLHPYALSVQEVAKIFKVDLRKGLHVFQVNERLKWCGFNSEKLMKRKHEVVKIQLITLAIFLISVFLIFIKPFIGIAMMFITIVIASILHQILSPKMEGLFSIIGGWVTNSNMVKVIREGKLTSTSIVELVPGDIVKLEKNMEVPADGRVIYSNNLYLNEKNLTGNNNLVLKQTAPLPINIPLNMRSNMVYSGTFVYSGEGYFIVTATGTYTEKSKLK